MKGRRIMAADYSQFQGKKVVIVRNEPGKAEAEEIEGTVEASNEMGVLIKPKGKSQLLLIEVAEIDHIDFVESKLKELTRKVLKPVEFGQARNHLLERHAYSLASVNKLTEKEAFEFHATIDHEGDDLGHTHEDKDATERAQAVAAAEVA